MVYDPKPMDTTKVQLDAGLTELTERLAESVHDAWARQRLSEGWKYGPFRSDTSKEHPNLVPYRELSEPEKEYDRRSALETIQMLLALGYKIEASSSKSDAVTAESTHTSEELQRLNDLLSKGPRLRELVAIWNARDQDKWRNSKALFRLLAEAVLKIGEPLLAYDVANRGLEHFPSSVRLRQLLGLALARSGASEAAGTVLMSLYGEGHQDEETLGLLARTQKDLAEGAVDAVTRQSCLRRAKDFYAKAYDTKNGYWSGVNAATLALLLGEPLYAAKVAREVRAICKEELKRLEVTGGDRYWVLATLGEVALILEEWVEAEGWYSQAVDAGRKRYGDLHSSWRNARLLMTHLKTHSDRIEACFHLPAVVVFAGHVVDQPERPVPRFPASVEPRIYAAIRERLIKMDAGFGYSSAACGSDILFCEAMLERDAEIHIVLPFEKSQFIEASIDRVSGWRARFETVIERAADVVVASERRVEGDGVLYDYANRLLYGLARGRAENLETELKPLAVWDGEPNDARGGTASAIELWRAAGDEIEIINTTAVLGREPAGAASTPRPLKRVEAPPADATREFAQEIRALLFADAVGFSKLGETEVPLFVRHFLGLVGKLVQEFSPAPLMKNTWGDGLYFVFPDVRSAGRFALELRDRIHATRWDEKGLRSLELRIGLHAGPVYRCVDPVTERENYIGAHVSRAARIEPITPPGYVYASQPFAALAAAEKELEFKCDYVGQTAMAKNYGTFPTYVVRYRRAKSDLRSAPAIQTAI
jgi:class 3 adenylate cyclase